MNLKADKETEVAERGLQVSSSALRVKCLGREAQPGSWTEGRKCGEEQIDARHLGSSSART